MVTPDPNTQSPPDHFRAALAMELPAIETRVIAVVARCLDRDAAKVNLTSTLWGDLDAESLDMLDIVYSLERTFIIRLPRLNLLQRATDLFGETTILDGGVITPTGLAIVSASMPEVPPSFFCPNMRLHDIRNAISVESLLRVVQRCLGANAALRCAACGGLPRQVPDFPMETCCSSCAAVMELPSGEELLIADLLRIGKELGVPRVDVSAEPAIAERP